MDLLLTYPALTEAHNAPIYERVRGELRAETEFQKDYDTGVAVAELRAHAIYIPLAPGDVVTYDIGTGEILSLVQRARVWTVDVDFALPGNLVTGQGLPANAERVISEVTEEWAREAWVTQHTGLSFYVSAPDRDWLEDRVLLCKYVDHMEMVRHPDMAIDLEIARANADLGDLTQGPWA